MGNGQAMNYDLSEYSPDNYTEQQLRVYRALGNAAYTINLAAYKEVKRKTGKYPKRHTPPAEVKTLTDARSKVLSGEMTIERGMALLHYGETGYALEMARNNQ